MITNFRIVKGDLIHLAKRGSFDLIAHGCNCQSNMGSGIAVPMSLHFDACNFPMEVAGPGIHKLGNIDYKTMAVYGGRWGVPVEDIGLEDTVNVFNLTVVNCYTQVYPNAKLKPLDYEALTVCMRKINALFPGRHIGLPWIGCGLAGGDKNRVQDILERALFNMEVTIVEYEK